jgi:hypothetical protein
MKLLEYRFRPKSDYYLKAPWKELYKHTEHLKHEISFYTVEVDFFEKLIAAYHHPEDANLVKVEQLVNDACQQIKTIHSQIDEHLLHVAQFLEDGDNTKDLLFREEHNIIEDTVSSFIGSFREMRNKLFSDLEKYIHEPALNR